MYHYKAPTPKRHYAFSNANISKLDKGTLKNWKLLKNKDKGIATAERYLDSSGKSRYKGTAHLRGTETLCCKPCH